MLRFIKHNLTEMIGIEMYPMISLVIFVLFFSFMIYRVVKMKKTDLEELSAIPLNDSTEEGRI